MLPEQCNECRKRDKEGINCSMYPMPEKQWTRIGGCAGHTEGYKKHVEKELRLNPLKASKRSRGK